MDLVTYAINKKYTDKKVSELSKEIAKRHPNLTTAQITSCKAFSDLFVDTVGRVDAFLFFTDPHTVHNSDVTTLFDDYLNQIEAVYNYTPTSMCVCGGDWLNNGNTKENASLLLGKIDGAMKKHFDNYVLIVGNHDTNYQGKEYMDSGADGTYDREASSECMLSETAIRNLWHRKQGASYFDVKCDSATYYVFDTGLDWEREMDAYRWTQVDWFANALLTDKPARCAALMHIADYNGAATPFVDAVTQIANAYNGKTSVTINGSTYNFAEADGTFGFVLGGHKHQDMNYTVNGMPVILTTNLQAATGYPTFDLVMVDWAAGAVNLVRVGAGENRKVLFDDGNLFEYGVRTDYLNISGTPVTDTTSTVFSVNAAERYIRSIDASGNSGVFYKNDRYSNNGSAFVLSADFVNETEGNTASTRFHCKMYTSDGELYTDAVPGWTYNSYYKSHFADTDRIEFTLPEAVRDFQIGFLFDSVENNTDYIRIYNISLTK